MDEANADDDQKMLDEKNGLLSWASIRGACLLA